MDINSESVQEQYIDIMHNHNIGSADSIAGITNIVDNINEIIFSSARVHQVENNRIFNSCKLVKTNGTTMSAVN